MTVTTDPRKTGVESLNWPVPYAGNVLCGAIGDSTVAGVLQSCDGITVQVGNAYAATFPPSAVGFERAGANSWLTHLCLLSGGRLILNHNGGVASDTSAGCLARIPYEISQAPRVLFMQMGVRNDINSGVATSTSKANVISAVQQVQAANIQPILVTCFPDNTDANCAAIRSWNEWLKWHGLVNGIPVVDIYKAVVDVTSATGDWNSSYSADGVHPNTLGAQVTAQYMLQQLVAIGLIPTVPNAAYFHRLADTDLGVGVNTANNMLNNPLFRQNSGSVTATSWTNTGTNSPSINTSPGTGILGNSQVITFAAGNTLTNFREQLTTVVGKRYGFAGLVKTTGMQSNNVTYSIGVCEGVGAPTCQSMAAQNLAGVDLANWTAFYLEFVAQTTTTRFNMAQVSGSVGGAATIEFAMARVVNLTDL